jgi:hypothetical protein
MLDQHLSIIYHDLIGRFASNKIKYNVPPFKIPHYWSITTILKVIPPLATARKQPYFPAGHDRINSTE